MNGQNNGDFVTILISKLSKCTHKESTPVLSLDVLKSHIEGSDYFEGYFSVLISQQEEKVADKSKHGVLQIEPKNSNPYSLSKNISLYITHNPSEDEFLCEIQAYSNHVCLSTFPIHSMNDVDSIMDEIQKSSPCQGSMLSEFISALQPLDLEDNDNVIISKELMSSVFIENLVGFSNELIVRSQSCRYLIPTSTKSMVKNETRRTICSQCSNIMKIPMLGNKISVKTERTTKDCAVLIEKLDTTSEDPSDYLSIKHEYGSDEDIFKEAEFSDDEDQEYKPPPASKKIREYTPRKKKKRKNVYDSDSDVDPNYDESKCVDGTTEWKLFSKGNCKTYYSNGYAYLQHKNYHSRKQLNCGNAKVRAKQNSLNSEPEVKDEEECGGYAIINNENNLMYVITPHTCQPVTEDDFSKQFRDIYYYDDLLHLGTENWTLVKCGKKPLWFSEGYAYIERGTRDYLKALKCRKHKLMTKGSIRQTCPGMAILNSDTKLMHLTVKHSCTPTTENELYSNMPQNFYKGIHCNKCGEGPFTDESIYEEHRIKHNKERRRMYHIRDMERRKQMEKPDPLPCCFCDKKFITMGKLVRHVHTYHDDKDVQIVDGHEELKKALAEETLEYCDECGIAVRKLDLHKKSVHMKDKTCKICNLQFGLSSYFAHMRKVHTKSSSFCEDCGKSFNCNSDLKKHWKVYHDPNYIPTLKCPVKCGFTASADKQIWQHLEFVHNYNWKCNLCGKVFSRSTGLKDHMPVHTGTKEFFCFSCDYCTSRLKDFQEHNRVRHGIKERISRQEYHAQSEAIGRRNEIKRNESSQE